MITLDEITDISYVIAQRFEKVNTYYLDLLAKQLKEIGTLSPEDLNTIEQMTKTGGNIDEINKYLMMQTGLALNDINALYLKVAKDIYKDVSYLYKAGNVEQPKFKDNNRLQTYIASVQKLTQNTFINMANTTVINKTYRDTIDFAIDAVSRGVGDYDTAIKKYVLDKSVNGARVQYASGLTRRLDSAARMNIMDGVRQVSNGIRKECGDQYGADGVEIDAHGLCAEDHIKVQGKQYTLKEFEKVNENLKRKIGTCNCRHQISYIILGVSKPAYSPEELQELKEYSTEKIQIKDKEITRYQASQLMRKTETSMRYKQDEIVTLKKTGVDISKQEESLRNLKKTYYYISKRAGLRTRYDRAYVPGFDIKKFR